MEKRKLRGSCCSVVDCSCVRYGEAVCHCEGVLHHSEAQAKDDSSYWFATVKAAARHGKEVHHVKG